MSNYRRLISYIYAYEGGIKGKNIGFAKIEVRNGQCRIHVNVKKIFLGNSDIGVYLLSPNREILLGRIFIRNGAGEFRVNVSAGNVEGSGCTMEQCYGLTIHETENTWRTYTTIWEDAVTQAAEVELADVTSDKVGAQTRQELRPSVSEEIKRQLEQEDARRDAVTPWKETGHGSGDARFQVITGMMSRESSGNSSGEQAQGGWGTGSTGEQTGDSIGRNIDGSTGQTVEENGEGVIGEGAEGLTGGNAGGQAAGTPGGETEGGEEGQPGENGKMRPGEELEGYSGEDVRRQSGGSAEGQIGGSAGEQSGGSTEGQIGGSAEGQIGGSAGEQSRGSAGGQIGESAGEQSRGSTGGQIGESTEGQTGGIARGQMGESTKGQTGGIPGGQTGGAAGERAEGQTGSTGQQAEDYKGGAGQQNGIETGEYTGERAEGFVEGSAWEQTKSNTGQQEAEGTGQQIRGEGDQTRGGAEKQSKEIAGPQNEAGTGAQTGYSQTGMAMAERLLASRRPAEGKSPGERLLEQLMIERPQAGSSGEENMGQNRDRVQERVLKFAKVLMQGKSPGTESAARQGTILEAVKTGPRPVSVIETTPRSLPEPGDPARLKELDRQEREEAVQGTIWGQLQRRYPKVLAFDYVHDSEILTIKPQDIGILPRENWVYGNNSFLLHGYYNYRHLILARLEIPGGSPRYLLGVPGHYFSNEKNLAAMFGFPNFVLAKKQPEEDGRFGYWYTDLRL